MYSNYIYPISTNKMEQRCLVWQRQLLGTRVEISSKHQVYTRFIYGRSDISETCRTTIAADMPRTWSAESIEQKDVIQELLVEYAATQQGDSYLQGFNYIMTVLWTVFRTAEHARADTFWSFVRIVGLIRPLMPDFNTAWFHWYRNHWMSEFQTQLARRRPLIAEMLSTDIETFSSLITVKWFMIWFTQTIPFSDIFSVWDLLIQVPPRQLVHVYTLLTVEIITQAATTLTYECGGNPTQLIHTLLELKIKGIANVLERVKKKL